VRKDVEIHPKGSLMRLTVIQLGGKIRDERLRSLRDEYIKRMQRFGRCDLVETKEMGKHWETPGLKKVALDERGVQWTSVQLAAWVQKFSDAGHPISFLIGDAHSLPSGSKENADLVLSLGPLTLPHEMAHLILIEQLYRVATINAGHPYHHA
jgi:23S rRNA (pseudouridine1915-N3)-methyltransferase